MRASGPYSSRQANDDSSQPGSHAHAHNYAHSNAASPTNAFSSAGALPFACGNVSSTTAHLLGCQASWNQMKNRLTAAIITIRAMVQHETSRESSRSHSRLPQIDDPMSAQNTDTHSHLANASSMNAINHGQRYRRRARPTPSAAPQSRHSQGEKI